MSSCRDITISAIQSSQPLNQWVETSVRKSRHSDATKATRALLIKQCHKQSLALDADLEEHHAKQEELIEMLALKYGRTEEYMRTLVCNGAKYGNKHGVNTKNAILHEYCNKAREEGGPSNVHDVQDEMSGEEYKRIKDSLSKEDLARLRAQLEEHHDTKHHSVWATNKSCQLDAVQTANCVGEVLRNLHLRTGVAAFAIFTWGNPDDAAKPHIVDSDDASRFFIDVLKMSPLDAVHKMEQWALDVDANTADAVRSQITDMANDGLCKIKNKQKLVTEWSNFRLKMVHELGVEMAGWPSNIEIKPPSKLCADDARRIHDLMRTGAIHWVTLTASQHAVVAQEIEAECAARTSKKRKQCSDKDHPRGPCAKKSTATKGTEGEAGAPAATAQSPGDGVQAAAMQVLAQAPSNSIQAAIALSPALGLTEVGAPASCLVAGPGSVAAPASSPTAAVTATEASGASSVPALGSVWGQLCASIGQCRRPAASPVAAGIAPATSPVAAGIAPASSPVAVAAVTAPASEASMASSVPAFGGGVSGTVGLDAAFGPGFDLNFDFTFLDHPPFAHQLPAEEEVLRLNTSNLDHNNWGFVGLGANSPFVNVHGANGSLLSFNGDDEVFPAALVLPNVNTATTASTSSTSVFSVATNTMGNKKRKRSGNDGGEKRPCKTRSDKDKPRGPRKSTTNMATANAAA
ncbi:hypothetical protein B0H14DRAFT_2579006 [Mycena olivaceomarginata]|nr:hypothetical protein B0H14DRAFT_2579006 [Mycena olivaceomarginata]